MNILIYSGSLYTYNILVLYLLSVPRKINIKFRHTNSNNEIITHLVRLNILSLGGILVI